MNLLDKIKADVARHEVMACYDLDGQLASLQAIGKTNDTPSYRITDGTATINVRGMLIPQAGEDFGDMLTGYDMIGSYLARADADPMVNNIVLDIDSAGGYVKGLDSVIEQIDNLSKPISTHASGDMYSAAYYLGVSTNRVTASKASGIGSIGVFAVHGENSKQLAAHGISMTLFKSGDWKGAFNSFMPLSQKEKDRLQAKIDESASLFFNFVAAKRDIDVATIAGWQGDTFSAAEAKRQGLIDEVMGANVATNLPVKADYLATNQNPMEASMDLVQALDEVSNLKGQVADKDTTIAQKDAQIAELQAKLSEQQARARQAKIDELAAATGKAFSDDELAAFAKMDDAQFAIVASLASKKPQLPKGLDKPQAVAGANVETLSGKIAAWGSK